MNYLILDDELGKAQLDSNVATLIGGDQTDTSSSSNIASNGNESVSRKNLNTIVEAIFHVEGIFELEEESPSQASPLSLDAAFSSNLTNLLSKSNNLDSNALSHMQPSSSCDATSSYSTSSTTALPLAQFNLIHNQTQPIQFQQQQKPPKKRKYTTEDISQMLPHQFDTIEQGQSSSSSQFKSNKLSFQATQSENNSFSQSQEHLKSQSTSDACFIGIAHLLKNNNSNDENNDSKNTTELLHTPLNSIIDVGGNSSTNTLNASVLKVLKSQTNNKNEEKLSLLVSSSWFTK